MNDDGLPGFYGKVPAHGDFVSRRLPRRFVEPWDSWLRSGIAASRGQLGADWLRAYLVSPVWRFCLSPGLCGPDAWAGILMPSVDRVGRYFPLSISVSLPPEAALFSAPVGGQEWFEQGEQVLVSALEDQGFDLEDFDRRIKALRAADLTVFRSAGKSPQEGAGWRVFVTSLEQLNTVYTDLLHGLAERNFGSYSIWWSEGSEFVEPGLLLCQGLPPVDGYSALLDSRWQGGSWSDWRLEGVSEVASQSVEQTR